MAEPQTAPDLWSVGAMPDGTAHTWPQDDGMEHLAGGTCDCDPVVIPVPREDGSLGCVYQHRPQDGRPFEAGGDA